MGLISQKSQRWLFFLVMKFWMPYNTTIQERDNSMDNRIYVAIDLKSFYASVECIERGLDPMDTRAGQRKPSVLLYRPH